MITLTIDGKKVSGREGQSVLHAALDAGIYIPHLCDHPDLEPKGGCRLCSVTINGAAVPVPACTTVIEEGMVVESRSPEAEDVRKTSMELILASHPEDCTDCPKYGKCELQTLYQIMGVNGQGWRQKQRIVPVNDKMPLIEHRFTRCIRCGRCIRACNDLRGVRVLDYIKDRSGIHAGIPDGRTLSEAGCRFCGACIEVCPTGSIVDAIGLMNRYDSYADNVEPCQAECPAHIDIPGYIRAVKEGHPETAHAIIREKVPFPGVLGYVCNHLCETACKRSKLNDPMSIKNLKRYAAENDDQQIWQQKGMKKERTRKKIAVIGSGPCGLTAAYYLNKLGHDVDVFEKKKRPGGPMTGGIPEYRLPKEVVEQEINWIIKSGVNLYLNTEISDLKKLKSEYDAVLLAAGVSKGRKLPIGGADFNQVYTAVEILERIRDGEDLQELGETVCVIGAGSVGYDTARSLIRKGKKVFLACVEQEDKILADEEDQTEGKEEGVILMPGRSFEEIEGAKERITGVRVHQVRSSVYDRASGKVVEDPIANSQSVIPCDSVVFATGQATGLEQYDGLGIELDGRGYPVITDKFFTSEPGIFAAGDVVTGISFVIRAIEQGREAASVIDRSLGGSGNIDETLVERKAEPFIGPEPGFAWAERISPHVCPASERIASGEPVCRTFGREEAEEEAKRCLQCDLRLALTRPKLWSEYPASDQ